MNDFELLPKERHTLKMMRGRDSVPEEEIFNCHFLRKNGLIVENYSSGQDNFGNYISDGTYRLTDDYWRYVSKKRKQLLYWLVPVSISAAALLISFFALVTKCNH